MRPKILTAFDGSQGSREALAFARLLATETSSQVIVATMYSPVIATDPVWPDGLEEILREQAESVLEEAKLLLDGADWQGCVVPMGSVPRALHELAESESAELVVVGATHHHGAGRIVPGSTASRTLHGSPCAVAVTPAHYSAPDRITRVGVGFDGSPECRHALQTAAALAAPVGATVVGITAFSPPHPADPYFAVTSYTHAIRRARKAARTALDEALAELPAGLAREARVITGNPVEVLANESAALDVLVVGSHCYGPLRRVLTGAVSGPTMHHAHCPVIAIPRGTPAAFGGDHAGADALAVT